MIENYRKLMYYAIMTVVLFSCVQQTVASDSSTEGILVNYTAKRYLFKQSTCLLYTSDAADEEDSVDLGGRHII